jgi:cytochrome c556
MYKERIFWQLVFALVWFWFAVELLADSDGAKKRQILMKANGEAVNAIKAAAETRDYAAIEAKAKDIVRNGEQVLDLFAKGRHAEKTKAKPDIWIRWDEFSKNPGKVKKAANELADAARARDDEAITVKMKILREACASCHNAFRSENHSN